MRPNRIQAVTRHASDDLESLAVKPATAAQLLDCSRNTIYNLIARGELRASKVGGLTRIKVDDLRALLERGEL